MKPIYSLALGLCCLMLSVSASAQREGKKFSVGFGLEAGIPTGDAKASYNVTGGMTIRFSYLAGPGYVTLTSGGIVFAPKSLNGETIKAGLQIPIKAGYKYLINEHFFVMGELGYSTVKTYYKDVNNNLASVSSGGFTFAPAIGVQSHSFEFSIRYESTSLNGGTLSFAGARIGFNF
jgi:hypothetical protein